MKKIFLLTLTALYIALTGCPYESEVGISTLDEALKPDKKLIDTWVMFSENGGRVELAVNKLEKTVLQVDIHQYKSNRHFKSDRYKALCTEVNKSLVFSLKNKDGKFMFAKYAWTGKNEFYLQLVNHDFVAENLKEEKITSKILKEFFVENIEKNKMYGKQLEFYRKNSPEHKKVKTFMLKSGF